MKAKDALLLTAPLGAMAVDAPAPVRKGKRGKSPMTKKTRKRRIRNRIAKQSRKINRRK